MRVTILLLLSLTVVGFASTKNQDEEIYPGKWDKGDFVKELPATRVYTGTFRLEGDAYPAILTEDGELYYLMVPSTFMSSDVLPGEGASLSIKAFKTPFSPVHLKVISAEMDGEELEMELYGGWGGRGRGPKGKGWHYLKDR